MVTFNVVTTKAPELIMRFTNSSKLFVIKSMRVVAIDDENFLEALVNILKHRVKQFSPENKFIELEEEYYYSLSPDGDLDVYGQTKVFSKLEFVQN